jgi:hypothetical protein
VIKEISPFSEFLMLKDNEIILFNNEPIENLDFMTQAELQLNRATLSPIGVTNKL